MIAYYVYGTLRFREVLENRLKNKADLSKIIISYMKASLTGFKKLVAATHDGRNAAFPVKGSKINGENLEEISAEAGKFLSPEGMLLLIEGPAVELAKILAPLERYEQNYVKVEVPVSDKEIKRAYVFAAYPWKLPPTELAKIADKTAEKLLNGLASYYNLSRMQPEETQKLVREAYEKEIKKNKSGVILHDLKKQNSLVQRLAK